MVPWCGTVRSRTALNNNKASLGLQACFLLVSRLAWIRKRVTYRCGTLKISSERQTGWEGRAPLDPARVAKSQVNDVTTRALWEPLRWFGFVVLCGRPGGVAPSVGLSLSARHSMLFICQIALNVQYLLSSIKLTFRNTVDRKG